MPHSDNFAWKLRLFVSKGDEMTDKRNRKWW